MTEETNPERAAAIYLFELYTLLHKASDHMRLAHLLSSFLKILGTNAKLPVPEELLELSRGLKELSSYIDATLNDIKLPAEPVDPNTLN